MRRRRVISASVSLALACTVYPGCSSDGKDEAECLVGTEACGCYGNETCDEGLSCHEGICVLADDHGGEGGRNSGGDRSNAGGGETARAGSAGRGGASGAPFGGRGGANVSGSAGTSGHLGSAGTAGGGAVAGMSGTNSIAGKSGGGGSAGSAGMAGEAGLAVGVAGSTAGGAGAAGTAVAGAPGAAAGGMSSGGTIALGGSGGAEYCAATENYPNLVNDSGEVGCDPFRLDDNPAGIEGVFFLFDDEVVCSVPEGNPCASGACCLDGTTIEDPTYEAWGCGIGLTLHTDGSEPPVSLPYDGPATCLELVLTGSSGGNAVRIGFTQSVVDEVFPSIEIPAVYGNWTGTVCFDDVRCPPWASEWECDISGHNYALQMQVVGGLRDSSFTLCLASLIPNSLLGTGGSPGAGGVPGAGGYLGVGGYAVTGGSAGFGTGGFFGSGGVPGVGGNVGLGGAPGYAGQGVGGVSAYGGQGVGGASGYGGQAGTVESGGTSNAAGSNGDGGQGGVGGQGGAESMAAGFGGVAGIPGAALVVPGKGEDLRSSPSCTETELAVNHAASR